MRSAKGREPGGELRSPDSRDPEGASGGRRGPPPRPAPPGTRCCPGARVAGFLRGAEAAAHRLQAQAPRAREPTRRAAGRLRRRPVAAAAAAAAARGRSRRAPLPPTEFLSPRRTRPRKRLERTRRPPQGLELRGRGRCSREAPAPAPPKLSPPFPSRAQSAARGAAGTRRALSVSRESCGLRGSGFLSPTLPGCGEPRRRLHGRSTAAGDRRQVTSRLDSAADGGSRARGQASSSPRSTFHNSCALRPRRRDCGFASKTCLGAGAGPAEETGSPGSQWQGRRAGGRRLRRPRPQGRQVGEAGPRIGLRAPAGALGAPGTRERRGGALEGGSGTRNPSQRLEFWTWRGSGWPALERQGEMAEGAVRPWRRTGLCLEKVKSRKLTRRKSDRTLRVKGNTVTHTNACWRRKGATSCYTEWV